ncbi:PREDICTED: ileal sodium/bile acid cotransporter-like isoform X3 [Dinoponera quadriceps]|nr:PREDICTED: ileal sodium/bile acid cotransporter-like isoform X3 [Dinoponera quadriceps]XP_014482408.1 PREDICTED: ileal sodium/bile acid cotransporter-like isoform X3 [Dinoponera quadriceps]XP_014482409.1 PREDICTED: ileal sodium/bile acid cotransporter-like isoform X3 [Dinoponera quadriceps]XP_014482410.1 PREDICTED: ileal sodium/bile acid cotransporter-like isoform X3 [Dinoponera quadriceps]
MAIVAAVIGFLLLQGAAAWKTKITSDITVRMNDVVSFPFVISNEVPTQSKLVLVPSADSDVAKLSLYVLVQNETSFNGVLNITGVFLGTTKLTFTLMENEDKIYNEDVAVITVIRKERAIDNAFTISVAVLVSILYINFGCAMDWNVCRNTLKRPIGPAIGFFCQFVIMPLLSFVIGYILFPGRPELQIGMFFTGVSPSGGASNIWTVLLEGNLNLSVTMTTLCTIAAFGMMPLWIFTLGRYIFERGNLTVPYHQIGTFVVGLVIPLAIGFLIQKKLPRVSKILIRIMKPFSVILILFIIVFAIVTNLYLFKLFSLEIVIAGMGLPWLGFLFGLIVAKLCRQPQADIRAIAIETGIQNTGVSIFLLRFTLKPPTSDLTTVVPVSSAIMTPIPLMILYIVKLIYQYRQRIKEKRISNFASSNKIQTVEGSMRSNVSRLIENTE